MSEWIGQRIEPTFECKLWVYPLARGIKDGWETCEYCAHSKIMHEKPQGDIACSICSAATPLCDATG
jgi:hypothetical protein